VLPILILLFSSACSGENTNDSADTGDCEILDGVSCLADSGNAEVPCPDGYTCSGLSAFWCYRGNCANLPECLPPSTLIAGPAGAVRLDALRPGALVFSLDETGRPIVVPVKRVEKRPAPQHHQVTTLDLSDGRWLSGSPAHPTAEGGHLGDLQVGDPFDGATILAVERTAFGHSHTWDLLPEGPTGHYQAEGVWLGTTLVRNGLARH
jgi:hypothetical protein